MAMRHHLPFAPIVALALAACGARTVAVPVDDAAVDVLPDTPLSVVPPGQKVVFEAGYQNWAWGYQCNGIYVTADGTVYSYECKDVAPRDGLRRYPGQTEAEILASYGTVTVMGSVSPALLAGKFGLVSSAEKGALIMESACADAGDRTFLAFRYDPSTKTYSPVRLGADGDNSVRNTEEAASALVDWLATVGGFGRDSCSPMPRVACVGDACASVPCDKAWQTRACDGTCTSPTRCESVSTCPTCGASYACVIDSAARKHCTYKPCSPTTCECAGDAVCASGKAWCRGSESEGFRCEKP